MDTWEANLRSIEQLVQSEQQAAEESLKRLHLEEQASREQHRAWLRDALEHRLGEELAAAGPRGAPEERLATLEGSWGRHERELQAAHRRLDQLHGRLAEPGHTALMLGPMQDQLERLERALEESAQKRAGAAGARRSAGGAGATA